MTKQWPTIADGRAGLVMFARGDRVFPVDDLGGGVWSRRGTVLSVHPVQWQEAPAAEDGVRVDAMPVATSPCARATVLWDDGSAEVLAEDKLCLVYDQEAPMGLRVVTMQMSQPCDVVDHGGQVVLVLREGLLAPEALGALRSALSRVRAALTPGNSDAASLAELRRRDLQLLNALIAELTGPDHAKASPSAQPGQAQPGQTQPGQTQPGQVQPGQVRPNQSSPIQSPPVPARPGRPASAPVAGNGIAVVGSDFTVASAARHTLPGPPGSDAVVVASAGGPGAPERRPELRTDAVFGRPDGARRNQDVEYGPGRTPGP
ncbi:hypothetical protein [Parafrankia sp. EUN1f]|uniref:hypothetical protein n=1 Tax=Parafrankia sp. EUN1f TaxID=102897 RepID=UPI0001C4671A|nr:hypothetical protein [Parafrankia sp. EUN1f]EFC83550.1 hypothetical protein FrEUN1fDRAFT_3346 [Parafrankia sp. EUN1f]